MANLRCDLLQKGVDIEYFHASEDQQATRNEVFSVIQRSLEYFRVDSVIAEKSKANPVIQSPEKFYPLILKHLLSFVFQNHEMRHASQVLVITDKLPVEKKRNAIIKGIKLSMADYARSSISYRITHHQSKAWWGLQVADYFNWAILRKWKDGDLRSYNLVQSAIGSEFDIFRNGTHHYY